MSNIDSRTSTSAQRRFKNTVHWDSIIACSQRSKEFCNTIAREADHGGRLTAVCGPQVAIQEAIRPDVDGRAGAEEFEARNGFIRVIGRVGPRVDDASERVQGFRPVEY